MNFIDRFLNGITMYRLALYALGILAALAFLASALGALPYSGLSLAISLALLLIVSYAADRACAELLRSARNPESALITALILFLILAPPAAATDAFYLVLGAVAAIASKYALSIRRKHLLNPAAVGAFVLALTPAGIATWWVATPVLFPAIVVLGFFIVRKLRRFDLWFAFMAAALSVRLAVPYFGGPPSGALLSWLVSWPTLFFSTVMLTEPLTMPPTRTTRILYGALTGILFSLPFTLIGIHSTPQLALLIGNAFAAMMSPFGRTRLVLRSRERKSAAVTEFTFIPDRRLPYRAGQYAEWTLSHARSDDRGVRRYFTFSSAPEEGTIRLAIRTGERMSSFKKKLMALPRGGAISISNVSGDFMLPRDARSKLLFVAGGVGITPFMSMLRSMHARQERRDIVLVYLASREAEFAYGDELAAARALGVRTVPVAGGGPLDEERLKALVPDAEERIAYISGPEGMVAHYRRILSRIGCRRIITDYFPGL